MSVQGSDFFTFAEDLLARAGSEIEYRNIISRLYYSLIHCTGRHLSSSAPTKYHTEMERYLKDPSKHANDEKIPSAELKALGLLLQARRAKRTISDYKLEDQVIRSDAESEMEIAKAIHEKLSSYL